MKYGFKYSDRVKYGTEEESQKAKQEKK